MSVEQPGPPAEAERTASRPKSTRLPLADRLRLGLVVLPSNESRFRHVRDAVARRYPQADLAPLTRAFEVAQRAHHSQVRVTGEPYVTHPIAVAQILADIGIDHTAVIAALL